MPLLHGSLVKTSQYNVPIYGLPDNLITVDLSLFFPSWEHKRLVGRVEGQKLVPYYTRAEIDKGVLEKHAPIIVWTDSVFDRLNLEIEGSGVVQLPNGEQIYLGYASGNGAPYTAIGRVLIDQGVLTRDNASMQRIRHYLETHPNKMTSVINRNKSFVFFKILDEQIALGAQGVGLTGGYSLAVDRQWIPMGTPLWLSTTHPDKKHHDKNVLQRLMIAQDTGGAIRGMVRGDIYWGAGDRAERIAGNMRNQGKYWLLIPKHVPIIRAIPNPPK
jgi:membrane-bound lytic murein transglycosylase A